MKRLGTPVFPRLLFRNLLEEFPEHTQLLLIYKGSRPVTGVLSFFFRDVILPYYAGASAAAPGLAANNFMYWELMKWAASRGFRWFDFGRSKKDTGAYLFKSQWGMQIEPLDYQVFLGKRRTVPNFSPANPKFELAARIWKRLPLPLTKVLGPRVVRWFP
jgi:FemAB-related protein (PEP-CTERM system-associated)